MIPVPGLDYGEETFAFVSFFMYFDLIDTRIFENALSQLRRGYVSANGHTSQRVQHD